MLDGTYRELRCGTLADVLAARGHDVVWWSSTFDHNAKQHRSVKSRIFELRVGVTLMLLHGPGYPSNVGWQRIRHHRALARHFAREARAAGPLPDVIFTCWPIPELAEQAVLFGAARGIPVIVDVRDLWPDVYLQVVPRWLRPIGRLALVTEFRRAARVVSGARAITAVSAGYLQWAIDAAGRSVRETDGVFPLGYPIPPSAEGVDVARVRERWGVAPGELVATFAGMLGSSYDLETVIDAARQLHAAGTPVRVLIAGDGDHARKLHDYARDLDNVRFTGWLGRDDVWALLSASDVGLASYCVDALQSLPNKPFEYMAAGLPIVSSLRGELAELIADHEIGIYYKAGDAADLASKLRLLAADSVCRARMSQRAKDLFVLMFSTDAIYPQLAARLELLARRPGSPRESAVQPSNVDSELARY